MASFITELKRRNVFKVGVAYAIVAWLLIQIVVAVETPLNLPNWVDTFTILVLMLGFPVSLIIAWAFELTPEGIKTTKSVDPVKSITQSTGQKLNYAITTLLSLAVVFLIVDNYVLDDATNNSDVIVDIEAPDVIDEPERLSNSVAILPCANLSPDPDNSYFAAGIHESTLNQLAKIRDISVIARTSVLQFENDPPPIPEIAEALNVEMVMECSVRYANDRVLITAQLIDGRTGAHIWSNEFNRGLTDVFAIQAEIAVSIANALEATLTPQEVASLNEQPTENTRAYDFYLNGKEYSRRSGLEDFSIPIAVQQYEWAVEEDPDFALAFAALSIAHIDMHWFGYDRSNKRRIMGLEAVKRALELAPDLPEAHHAFANYYYHGFRDYDNALKELEIAEQGMPSDPLLLYTRSDIYRRNGDLDRSLVERARAFESDPRNTRHLLNQASTYFRLRNYTEAERFIDRALEVQPDSGAAYVKKIQIPLFQNGEEAVTRMALENTQLDLGAEGHWVRWIVALYDRNYVAALRSLDEIQEDDLELRARIYNRASLRGLTYQLAGQVDLAKLQFEIARTQIETILKTNPNDQRYYIALGEVFAGLGERDAAVQQVERALEIMPPSLDALDGRSVQQEAILRVLVPAAAYDSALNMLDEYLSVPGGWWSIEGLSPDPRLDPIRDDPRFIALVEKYKRQ